MPTAIRLPRIDTLEADRNNTDIVMLPQDAAEPLPYAMPTPPAVCYAASDPERAAAEHCAVPLPGA